MPIDIHSEDAQTIRQLIPISTIPVHQFELLCNEITIETAKRNTFLFSKNDTSSDLVYLIEGSVTLQSETLKIETIKSGSQSACFALAHQIPRKIDAYSNTSVRFLRLSLDQINVPHNISYEEEDTDYMVVDEPEEVDDDWMTTLLKSPIFRALPPANLQKIIMGLEEVSFNKGDLIIEQGQPGDCYYIIKKGNCLLSRKPSPNAKEIKLAQLRNQDTFGEDSLLSGEPRNVNIRALSNTSLLRLSKDKFISLIKEPTLQFVNHDQVSDKIAEGAILLDVRTPDEYKQGHLPKSVNTPFFSLRMQLKIFDKTKPALVICKNGEISQAAAFLLLRNKINAFVVTGGMEQQPQSKPVDAAKEAASFAIDDGIETLSGDLVKTTENSDAGNEALVETGIQSQETEDPVLLENKQLKLTIQKLSAEKEQLEKQYRLLYKQTEKLKAVLDSLKK